MPSRWNEGMKRPWGDQKVNLYKHALIFLCVVWKQAQLAEYTIAPCLIPILY